MKQVRFTEDPRECCRKILNVEAVNGQSYCGKMSIHGTEEKPLYFICGECYLRLEYSAKLQAERV